MLYAETKVSIKILATSMNFGLNVPHFGGMSHTLHDNTAKEGRAPINRYIYALKGVREVANYANNSTDRLCENANKGGRGSKIPKILRT